MTDRFKFRVWDKENENYCLKYETVLKSEEGDLYFESDDYYGGLNYMHPNDYIIEQCTGLKDKSGKLIYEGDIVKGEHTYNLIVKLDNVGVKYEVLQGKEAEFIEQYLAVDLVNDEDGFVYEQHFEIIGNIHENKELLNKER